MTENVPDSVSGLMGIIEERDAEVAERREFPNGIRILWPIGAINLVWIRSVYRDADLLWALAEAARLGLVEYNEREGTVRRKPSNF